MGRLLQGNRWDALCKRVCDQPIPHMPYASEVLRLLALLFSENSPFYAAAATLFSKIELDLQYPEIGIDLSARMLNIGPDMFEGEAKEMELVRKIFTACGSCVRKIVVVEGPPEDAQAKHFMELFTWHVFKYCRNVEEVAFSRGGAGLMKWGKASSFIREYAANLRTIDCQVEEDEEGFLDFRKCMNLRRWRSNTLSTARLVSFLKTCGSTLEELDIAIKTVGDSVEVIETIRNYCKQLNVIRIGNVKAVIDIVGQESYSSLICSYGSKLKEASVDGLGHEHLVEVVNACTNVQFVVCSFGENVDWQRVYDLGPRMVMLCFNPSLLIGDEYPRAFEQCTNLRRLVLVGGIRDESHGVTDEMIFNVFSPASFPKLESLRIRKFRANEQNMRLIASCTANLRGARFEPFESESESRVFRFISDSNKYLQRISVSLDVGRNLESGLERLSELVKMFRQCRDLTFKISCSVEGRVGKEDLISICKVLPCRDVYVHVRIGHVNYRYPN